MPPACLRAAARARMAGAIGALSVTIAAGSAIAAPTAAMAEPPRVPSACMTAVRSMTSHTIDLSSFGSSGIVVIDGWSVDTRTDRWRARYKQNPSLTTAFHSDAWLIPASNEDLSAPIAAMVEQARVSPDPGGDSDSATQSRTGWKEGHVTRRLATALCFYEWTTSPDDRAALTPVIEQLAAAASDPLRYYGPPRVRPHNHGLMSDITLDRAGRMLHRDDWVATARDRVHLQLQETFDSCGMVFEQAAAYQLLHAGLWRRIARFTEGTTQQEAADASARALERIEQLRDLDGSLPVIGDAGPAYRPEPLAGWKPRADALLCPETGWFAQTTVTSHVRQHAIVRFGPRPKMHGHADHGSLTWTVGDRTRVVPVLADRGLYDKTRGERLLYARSVAAHSTLQAPDLQERFMDGRVETLPSGRRITLTADQPTGKWHRTIVFHRDAMVLDVTDRLTGDLARRYQTQRFSLDPRWRAAGDRFVTADGWRLTVSCQADGEPALPKKVAVEHYPGGRRVQSAVSVDCQAPRRDEGITLHTILTVFPPAKG